MDWKLLNDWDAWDCMSGWNVVLCRGSLFPAVADDIRDTASKDPVHRKLFVRGLAWETSSVALREVSAFMDACEFWICGSGRFL